MVTVLPPAELPLLKSKPLLLLMVTVLVPLTAIPATLKFRVLAAPTVNAKFEAPVLKVKPPIVVVAIENVRLVVLDVAKDAVPVGTAVLGFQFVAVSKSLVAGLASHVASTARAAVLESATPMARTPTYNTRRARKLLRPRPLVFNPSIKTPSENIPVSRVVRSCIPLREELK